VESSKAIKDYSKQTTSVYENQLNSLLSDIKTNPIYAFADSVKQTVKNPVGELIKSLAAKNGEEIANLDELLDLI
jgi:hypothetical protein